LLEQNPMLGLRGCRLGNLYPEITEMQTRAILEAALELKSQGKEVYPEFMVPLTSILYEFQAQKKIIDATAQQVFAEHKVGTMTEIPCAALTAHRNRSRVRYRAFFERLSS
jgi:pyruvate,orthophosphate dikinase